MSRSVHVVSDSDHRDRSPRTGSGLFLGDLAGGEAPEFMIHEVGFLKNGLPWNFDRVCSPFWRLYHNLKPGSRVGWNGRWIPLRPERILILPENLLFHCRGGIGTPHFWVHFSPIPSAAFQGEAPIEVGVESEIEASLKRLRRIFPHLPPAGPGRISGPVLRQLYHSAAALVHACFARAPLVLRRQLPPRLQNLLQTIQNSPGEDFPNPLLARHAGMSVEAFIRWFRRHLRVTPARYVMRNRIHAACRLLAFTDRSIEQIAEETGFPNRYHLSRVFSKMMDCGPATFRRRHPGGFTTKQGDGLKAEG